MRISAVELVICWIGIIYGRKFECFPPDPNGKSMRQIPRPIDELGEAIISNTTAVGGRAVTAAADERSATTL